MSLLRRAALRALSARPAATVSSSPFHAASRINVACTPVTARSQRQWAVAQWQRAFSSTPSSLVGETPGLDTEAESTGAASTIDDVGESTMAQEEVDEVVKEANAGESSMAADAVEAVKDGASQVAESASAAAGAAVSAATGALPGLTNEVQVRRPFGTIAPNSTLYVGNIFFETTDEDLREYFSDFGDIKSVSLIRDQRGLSKGFGYIEFGDLDAASRAIEARNQELFHGRRLTVQYHRPRLARTDKVERTPNKPSRTLFIGNMSFQMSDQDLNDLFRDVRNVLDVRVAIDRRSGQPRGFAHADFSDEASATKAKQQLEAKEIFGRRLRVDYSNSHSTDSRSRVLEKVNSS